MQNHLLFTYLYVVSSHIVSLYFAVERLICVGLGFMFSLLLNLSLNTISHCEALKCRITAQHQGSLNWCVACQQ